MLLAALVPLLFLRGDELPRLRIAGWLTAGASLPRLSTALLLLGLVAFATATTVLALLAGLAALAGLLLAAPLA